MTETPAPRESGTSDDRAAWSLVAEAERLEAALQDRKPKLTASAAIAEANRCLYCHDAPCIKACPTGIDIPTFIRKIGTGNLSGSARVILDANILGLSCARVCPTEVLCEGDCVYNHLDQPPIAIGKLQRVATEYAYDRGQRFFERGAPNGRRVALIGAGPASLACAHELSRLGYESTIFEKRDLPGGLNSTGVAPYKLHLDDSLRELSYILEIGGITLKTGVEIGGEVGFEMLAEDFDAVFIGFGLGEDGMMGAEGEQAEGISGAVAFIERLKTEPGFTVEGVRSAAIIGGGNTAIDCVRELRGLGVPKVQMIYRRDEDTMSGYTHEWTYAKAEGAVGVFHAQPLRFIEADGRVRAVECAPTRIEEGSGRLVVDAHAPFEVEADLVLLAIGQSKLGAMLADVEGIQLDRGRVITDPATGQTGNPRFFAGGDCANGGKEVVNAAAEGKRAARGIHAWLDSQP